MDKKNIILLELVVVIFILIMGIAIVFNMNNQIVDVTNNTTELNQINNSTEVAVDSVVQETQPETSKSTYYNGKDLSGGSGESVEIEYVDEDTGFIYGYKGGRHGTWTPTGSFLED